MAVHLRSSATAAGIQLRSGKWVSSLVYADDVTLPSYLASGLPQLLLHSMDCFCLDLGLVISHTKTKLFISMAVALQAFGNEVLLQSAGFKYLALVFHHSGSMSCALQQLARNAVGACAQLRARFTGLLCQKLPHDEAIIRCPGHADSVLQFGGVGPFLLPKFTA